MRTSTFVIQLSAGLCGVAALAFAQTQAACLRKSQIALDPRRRVQRG